MDPKYPKQSSKRTNRTSWFQNLQQNHSSQNGMIIAHRNTYEPIEQNIEKVFSTNSAGKIGNLHAK